MCGRWLAPFSKESLEKRYNISAPLFHPSYNIAPGSLNTVIVKDTKRHAKQMKWGLIPFWAKDPRIGYKMINARVESLTDKPSYRIPLQSRRCLIPSGGFYEWKKNSGSKIPYYIHLKNNEIFSFAGLYDIWKTSDGSITESFTIITTMPNSILEPIHDRMPVILSVENEEEWISKTNTDRLLQLLRPYEKEDEMEAYPISAAVNDPSNNFKALLQSTASQG